MQSYFYISNGFWISSILGLCLGIFLGTKHNRPSLALLVLSFVTPVLLSAIESAILFSQADAERLLVVWVILTNSALTGAVFVTNLSISLLACVFIRSTYKAIWS
jgi:hypothetical protein